MTMDQLGIVVLGPLTRLGQAVARELTGGDATTVVVAREKAELPAIRANWPTAEIVTAEDPIPPAGTSSRCAVLALAVGRIHPEGGEYPSDRDAFDRDLRVLARVLEARRGVPSHVVLVSTVLARATARDNRRRYAGWKLLAEAEVSALAAKHSDTVVSIVSPGRLIDGPGGSPWQPLLHTRYRTLARRIVDLARSGKPRRRLCGLDARLFLLGRAISNGFAALLKG